MRLLMLAVLLSFSLPAFAAETNTPPADPAYAAWDQCVAKNLKDYSSMFGRASVNRKNTKYVTRALDDCYDQETAFASAHSQAQADKTHDVLLAKYLNIYKPK